MYLFNNLFEKYLQQKNQEISIYYTTKHSMRQLIRQKLHERHFSFWNRFYLLYLAGTIS